MKLFKDYTEEFNKLKIEVISTRNHLSTKVDVETEKTLRELHNSVSKLETQHNQLANELSEIKQLLINNLAEPVEEEIEVKEEPEPLQEIYYGNLRLSKSSRKNFRYTSIDESSFKFYYSVRNRNYFSDYTIHDVLLLIQLEFEEGFQTWTDLHHLTGMPTEVLKKIAYNIKTGFFDSFIRELNIHFSKEYGLLYVDNKKTNVPVRTAKYIVECVNNSSRPAITILKLEKTGECPKELCRLIGVNSKNNSLLSLFEDNPIELENNPQKRKEKGL